MRARLVLTFFGLCLALGCSTTPAANDAATSGNDAATDNDAASGNDAASDNDAATGDDAATPTECSATFADCTTTSTEDFTGMATVTIGFGAGNTYDHKCIRVSAGTVVTLPGSSFHPLTAASCSTAGGPTLTTTGGDFTFANAGHYGYYCANHGTDTGQFMAGLIIVE